MCGLRSKETQKKLLTKEHTFDAALKVALGAEAAEKDVAAFSQESSGSVNKADSGNRRSFHSTQRRKGPGRLAIKQAPRPENLTQLRAFLGMIHYHGKFVRNLSSIDILQPLNQLLKVTKNSSGPSGARRYLKRPRTQSHLPMYWFIMTQAFLLFLRAMQASMAS